MCVRLHLLPKPQLGHCVYFELPFVLASYRRFCGLMPITWGSAPCFPQASDATEWGAGLPDPAQRTTSSSAVCVVPSGDVTATVPRSASGDSAYGSRARCSSAATSGLSARLPSRSRVLRRSCLVKRFPELA